MVRRAEASGGGVVVVGGGFALLHPRPQTPPEKCRFFQDYTPRRREEAPQAPSDSPSFKLRR